jgi:hypothetical protein
MKGLIRNTQNNTRKHFLFLLFFIFTFCYSNAQQGREQWSEEKAWEWQKEIGIIKGFNQPVEAYPGMPRKEIFKKAAELGFNSVRFFKSFKTPDEHIKYIRELAEDADLYGLKVSPVLSIQYIYYPRKDKQKAFEEAKAYTQKVVGAFANDSRVVLWDVWNEPNCEESPEMYEQMDWIEAAVGWCREMSPIQPITSSIFWDTYINADTISPAIKRRSDVEAMMDVHNFHHYQVAEDHMKGLDVMINRLKKISNRPLVCTEAIARTTGATFPRTFVGFSKYNVHFFTWGLYMCDMNWTVSWGRSTYEPFEPMFHELLHPDGEPYDYRDLQWLRNFHFAREGEETDPGAEVTERWSKERAWKWMINGPIKGLSLTDKKSSDISLTKQSAFYNGIRVKCDYREWEKDQNSFYQKMDKLLSSCDNSGKRVIPALLTDDYVNEKDSILAIYVARVIKKYATDPRIQAWEIYTHPGRKEMDTEKLDRLLRILFRFARFEFPNQPLTATPWVCVKDFAPDFDYMKALIHGRMHGWDYLSFEGGSTPKLCNLIWELSDIVSFPSSQKAAETGWLTSIAYRYGRPLICTEWIAPDKQEERQILDIFAKSHVFWYHSGALKDENSAKTFQFKPITTPIK